MRKAWIEDDRIRDLAPGSDPFDWYHPDVAKFYDTEVPDNAENGDGFKNGVLTKRPVSPPPPPVPPAPRTWTADSIRAGMTLGERVKWDNNSAPEIVTAKVEMAAPQELAHTTEVLDLLLVANLISQATKDKILA